MKYKKCIVLLLITNIILIGIVYNTINKNKILANEKQILKEMTTSEREQELENKIDELNTSATEYATYVQNCKTQIAEAITAKGVTTSGNDSIDVIVENINKISSGQHWVLIETGIDTNTVGWTVATIDVSSYVPEGVTITKDNFLLVPGQISAFTGNHGLYVNMITGYDSTNKTLTLEVGTTISGTSYQLSMNSGKLYLIW